MSTIRLSSLRGPVSRTTTLSRPIGARRSFQSGPRLTAGKESELHVEDRAEKVEYEKHQQLTKRKEGRPEWSDSLSSDSESIVKADRGEHTDQKQTIVELQEETVKTVKKEKAEKGH